MDSSAAPRMCVLDRDDEHEIDDRFHRKQRDAKLNRESRCRQRRDVFCSGKDKQKLGRKVQRNQGLKTRKTVCTCHMKSLNVSIGPAK